MSEPQREGADSQSGASGGGLDRLADAVEKFLAWERGGRAERPDELLDANEDLYELLAPLLATATHEHELAPKGELELEGRLLGEFRLGIEIGRGAMGIVHRARQTTLGRDVAVKVLPAEAGLRARTRARFRREASLVARLEHPGIVKVLGVGEQDGLTYFAMELVPGVSLADALRRLRGRDVAKLSGPDFAQATLAELEAHPALSASGSTSEGRRSESSRDAATGWRASYADSAASIVAEVARALHHAHENGVIHRDVKPSNVLVRPSGRTVLTDFGLAREEAKPSLTATGEFAGTPYYTSPEQALGEHARVDRRTDVWALGVTLYELLTHRRPFEGRSTHEVFQRIQREEPLDPRRHVRELPRDLAAIALKAMQKDPAQRYQTAGEMADDLEAYLRHEPVRARPAGPWRRLRRWARRDPSRAALCAVLGLGVPALAALGGYLLARRAVLEAGERAIERERVEALLADAYGALYDDPPHAPALFAALRREMPEEPAAAIGLGLALCESRGAEAAALELEHSGLGALRTHPALARLADHYRRRQGETAEAREPAGTHLEAFVEGMLARIAATRTEDPELYRRAAVELRRAALLAPAPRRFVLQEYAKAVAFLDDAELARECSAALLAHWPEHARACYWAGFAWRRTDVAHCFELTARASALEPTDALVAFYHAFALFEERRYAELLAFVDERVQRGVAGGNDHGLRGLALEARGEKEAARAAFDAARERGALAFPLEIRVLCARGEIENAERLLLQRTALEPDQPRWWLERLRLRTRRSDWEGVLRLAREAAAAIPQHPGIQVLEGRALARLSRFAEAEPLLTALLESSEEASAAYELALGHQRSGDLERAEPLARRAAAARPDGFYERYLLGCVLGGRNRHAEARAEIEAAIAIDDRVHDAHYNLGAMCHMLGEVEQAITCYRRCLELAPDFEPAKAALKIAEGH